MGKRLCDLKKSLKTDFDSYMKLVNEPSHVCTKCGRAANCKKLVCAPMKLRRK